MSNEDKHFEGVKINGSDPRMRFRNSQDPIYVAYQYVDNQSMSTLFKAFVKDTFKKFMALFTPKNKKR